MKVTFVPQCIVLTITINSCWRQSGAACVCGRSASYTVLHPLPLLTRGGAAEIQCKTLGMKVEIFDLNGKSVEDEGVPGELVCTRPHPSQPLGFWGDESGERVRKAYFSTYPGSSFHRRDRAWVGAADSSVGVWHQGDFIVKNSKTQGLMILGRRHVFSSPRLTQTKSDSPTFVTSSDGVLNPSGVRFGSAEIYSVLEDFSDAVDDSLCVGQRRPQDKDERVLLFLKMRPGHAFSDALINRVRSAIRTALSPRHVPAYIFEIDEIPVRPSFLRHSYLLRLMLSTYSTR